MKTEHKCSEAAMRAAEQLHAEGRLHPDIRRGFAITEAAQVIDRELSAPSMEQRARAAAQELFEQRWIPPTDVVKSIILSHFAGMQGGNEKLLRCLRGAVDSVNAIKGNPRPMPGSDLEEWMQTIREFEALAQPADDRRKDSERLDWLEQQMPHIYWSTNANHPEQPTGPCAVATGPGVTFYRETFRQAIDAAMEQARAALKSAGERG